MVSGSILCSISGLVQGLTVYFMVGFELSVDKLINYLVIIVLTACTVSQSAYAEGSPAATTPLVEGRHI